MTNALSSLSPQIPVQPPETDAIDRAVQNREQQLGRMLINNLFVLLKTAYIHQQNNAALHRPLASIQDTTSALFRHTEDDTIILRPVANTFFLNQTLIRLDLLSFRNSEFLRIICGEVRIGAFEFYHGCDEKAFRNMMTSVVDTVRDGSTRLRRDFETIYLKPPAGLVTGQRTLHQRQFTLQSYALALSFTSHMLARWPGGKQPPLSRIKRTVQNLLEIAEQDIATLLGLMQLRAYREYLATHLVNVTILSLLIAQRAGLSRPEIVQLGMTALLHELGAIDLPVELIERVQPLDDKEKQELDTLPLHTIRRLLEFPVIGIEGIARAVTVFENAAHIRTTRTYPFQMAADMRAEIIAVADAYDHLITPRMGKSALRPDQALDVLLHNPEGKFAAWGVKLLLSAIGRYPIGTLVQLDTGECGIVFDPPEIGAPVGRPRVRLILHPDGTPATQGAVIDLREMDEAGYPLRSIRNTLSPDQIPVNIPPFFLD